MAVCATCTGLQKHLKDPAQDIATGTSSVRWMNATLAHLRASSGGCRACALILNGVLLYHGRFATVKEDKIKVIAESFHSDRTKTLQEHLSVEIRWQEHQDECGDSDDEHEHEESYPDLKLEFFADEYGQSAFSAVGRGRPIITNPLHEAGIRTIRNVLDQCNVEHSLCSDRKAGVLPRRVLDLSQEPSKGIRLLEAESNKTAQDRPEYLALSYCWGIGRGVPQTTTKTLGAHKKNVLWSSLPKAFQEAVLLTRALGVRYLWIDSLCIVQDDPSDKLRTSLELDSIFGNALLTIAATSAVDPSQGVVAPQIQTFKLQATDSKRTLSKIYVREQPSHYSFKAPFSPGSHMNDWELPFNTSKQANAQTPLLRRAWAFAERLISPRVLHFTSSEMILECREGFLCECGRIADSTYDSRTTDSVKQEFASLTTRSGKREPNKRTDSLVSQFAATSLTNDVGTASATSALELWSYIVTEYTARNLTHDEDRLLAIAGVAKILSPVTNAGYIAGHWTSSTLGLLWYPNEGTHCRRPKQVLGRNTPSWSWASVEGSPIFFDNSSAIDLACSATFPVNGSQSRIFSPASGDTVELSAAMATDVTFSEDAPNEYLLTRNGISVEFQPDVIPIRGEDMVKSGETLVCVLVSMSFRSSILGIVLKKMRTKSPAYRRVGRLECYECLRVGKEDDPEDAEALFEHWFPEVDDMTQLDERPRQTFKII
ncbi:HET-domain-containing protein [Bimuria novae-zelandiae CBS 107.79]|uniref:HET-domain-containing protein n=1 Tax=Bimuria novae-zelandiae CBS 107.79 TaxID=1447943 RepID=A0A6A5VLB7_9PLEO|nr:HET-domain-containing protein [Bimuria novae-zelandiae CBS 107.79]